MSFYGIMNINGAKIDVDSTIETFRKFAEIGSEVEIKNEGAKDVKGSYFIKPDGSKIIKQRLTVEVPYTLSAVQLKNINDSKSITCTHNVMHSECN